MKKTDAEGGSGGSYDPIDEIAASEEDVAAEYGMHVAVDFNVMVVYCNTAFHQSHPIPPNMGVKRLSYQSANGRQFFTTGLDVSQMHIPFRSYQLISAG